MDQNTLLIISWTACQLESSDDKVVATNTPNQISQKSYQTYAYQPRLSCDDEISLSDTIIISAFPP